MVMPPPKQQPTITGYISLERFMPVDREMPRIRAISRPAAPVLDRKPDIRPEKRTVTNMSFRSLPANFVKTWAILAAPPVLKTASPTIAMHTMIMAVPEEKAARAVDASTAPVR